MEPGEDGVRDRRRAERSVAAPARITAVTARGASRQPFAVDYLDPQLPPGLQVVRMPIVDATADSLEGYGRLVDDPADCRIEIVRWPAQGTRPIDADTGDQGGTTEGVFVSEWRGDILYGRNEAV